MANATRPITSSPPSAQDQPLSWAQLSVHTYVRIGIIAVLLWALFRVQIRAIVHTWNVDASWSHGYLIPLFSLYFLNQQKREILTLQPRASLTGLILLLGCLVFFVLDVITFRIAYFEWLTPIAVLACVVLFLGGWRLLRYTWLPIFFLVFAVPLPDRAYKQIAIRLQTLASEVARWVLNLVPDLQATGTGVAINVVYGGEMRGQLEVAEECSGMRLLMAFVALGVTMAYLHKRPAIQRVILLASTIPTAILCNVVRVTIMGLASGFCRPDHARFVLDHHEMLGLLMLPLAFGVYGALSWFMNHLFVDETATTADVVVRREKAEAS